MKKFTSFCVLAACAMAMSPNEAVSKFAKQMLPENMQVSVSKQADLGGGWESLTVKISDPSGAQVGEDMLFSDGKFIAPLLIEAESGKDFKAQFSADAEKRAQAAIAKAIPEYVKGHKNAVRLGNKGGAVTAVFSDPDCPFCRRHLAGLEEELKKGDILMILTPLPMHKNALNKAALLLDEVEKLGTKASTEQKLAVFKKYFADGEFGEASKEAKARLDKEVRDAFNLGVNYTPAIFENIVLK